MATTPLTLKDPIAGYDYQVQCQLTRSDGAWLESFTALGRAAGGDEAPLEATCLGKACLQGAKLREERMHNPR